MEKAAAIGFDRFIISATTPFAPGDVDELRKHAAAVVRRYVPSYEPEYERRRMVANAVYRPGLCK